MNDYHTREVNRDFPTQTPLLEVSPILSRFLINQSLPFLDILVGFLFLSLARQEEPLKNPGREGDPVSKDHSTQSIHSSPLLSLVLTNGLTFSFWVF